MTRRTPRDPAAVEAAYWAAVDAAADSLPDLTPQQRGELSLLLADARPSAAAIPRTA